MKVNFNSVLLLGTYLLFQTTKIKSQKKWEFAKRGEPIYTKKLIFKKSVLVIIVSGCTE